MAYKKNEIFLPNVIFSFFKLLLYVGTLFDFNIVQIIMYVHVSTEGFDTWRAQNPEVWRPFVWSTASQHTMFQG